MKEVCCLFHYCRKQTNVLNLHNPTLLPVIWKFSGVESLGEEFSFSQDHGVVGPKSTVTVQVHFRAAKQVIYTKKAFKVEVSYSCSYTLIPRPLMRIAHNYQYRSLM